MTFSSDSTEEGDPPMHWLLTYLVYFVWLLLVFISSIRDYLGKISGYTIYKRAKKGFSPLSPTWENFFKRRLFRRVQDCWNRPICSSPGSHIDVMERETNDDFFSFQTTGKSSRCVNVGSYNYLGFADDWKSSPCRDSVLKSVDEWSISTCSSRSDLGSTEIHDRLETLVARFVGKPKAMVFAMGYATNTSTIQALMGEESLIISDSLNHISIVNGARSSVSQIRVFRHNCPSHLEEVLRESIIHGQPRIRRPWKKILVIVEGIYSMEGDICRLKEIVAVCKKYKAFLYVDEAHSIGALGATGRGVCEHTGVDPADVDILMGTFTKSFSGMGGYIASSEEVINFLKSRSAGSLYHTSISPVVTEQIYTALRVIMGEDGSSIGQEKLKSLKDNSNYFRNAMHDLGLQVLGNKDSPIIPVLVYFPTTVSFFSRECLRRGLAVVVVGFPAVPVLKSRSRFCISAGHSKEDLDKAIQVISEVAELAHIKYSIRTLG